MVPFARSLHDQLERFIRERITDGHSGCFEVSTVKRDGTVFVRFKSVGDRPATFLVERFVCELGRDGLSYVQIDNVRFRLALDQFGQRCNPPTR